MIEEKRKIDGMPKVLKIIILVGILVIAGLCISIILADEKSYTGEFITANKVYMPDNNIKLVIYFNESDGNIHFKIFDNWDARHSVLLSNMETGTTIKIIYKDYVFRDCREIVRVEKL